MRLHDLVPRRHRGQPVAFLCHARCDWAGCVCAAARDAGAHAWVDLVAEPSTPASYGRGVPLSAFPIRQVAQSPTPGPAAREAAACETELRESMAREAAAKDAATREAAARVTATREVAVREAAA